MKKCLHLQILKARSEHFFDSWDDLLRQLSGLVELNHLAFLIHQELAPAPRDLLDTFLASLQLHSLASQELIDLVGISTIHVDFFEHLELDSPLVLECLDVLFRPLFLVEGVGGEAKDSQTSWPIFFVHLHQLGVGLLCHSSGRSYVHAQNCLFSFKEVS